MQALQQQFSVCYPLFALGPFSSDCIVQLMWVVLQSVEIHARPSLNSPISPAAVLISVFRNGPHGLVPCICKYERLPFLPLVCFLYDWPVVSLCTNPSAGTPTRAISQSAVVKVLHSFSIEGQGRAPVVKGLHYPVKAVCIMCSSVYRGRAAPSLSCVP